jgi:hypothetical protein
MHSMRTVTLRYNALVFSAVLLCLSSPSWAQGTIIFNNRSLTDRASGLIYHAPVTLPDGTGASGSEFTAGLFLVEGQQTTLLATTYFRTGPAAGFVVQLPDTVKVPGILPGSPATFRARVWETSAGSYEGAVQRHMLHGEFLTGQPDNNLFVPALGPPPGGPFVDPDLSGIQPLTLVPEPATGVLLILGAFICFAVGRGRRR